jgi:hypothetical protein
MASREAFVPLLLRPQYQGHAASRDKDSVLGGAVVQYLCPVMAAQVE